MPTAPDRSPPPPDEPPRTAASTFDYDAIPEGYYDRVMREGNPVRRLWHTSKFERVLDYLPSGPSQSILDIGCFAGTFLSMVPESMFARQLGVDILAAQVDYAQARYGTAFRRFQHLPAITALSRIDERFDCVTLIEVIEHLAPVEIEALLARIARLLRPGGRLVLTTPNYTSMWPLLEVILNRASEVSYQEQHITRFHWFNFERKLAALYPPLGDEFDIDLKTTTHLATPFLAALSFEGARRLSRLVPHRRWRLPFGNLLLVVLTRRG